MRCLQETVSLPWAGRAAEALTLDDISTGASNDLQRATSIAKQMVTKQRHEQQAGPCVL